MPLFTAGFGAVATIGLVPPTAVAPEMHRGSMPPITMPGKSSLVRASSEITDESLSGVGEHAFGLREPPEP